MDFSLTPEQEQIGSVCRSFCERTYPSRELRKRIDSGTVPDLTTWRTMAEQLGVAGVRVPEAHGGLGGSMVDLVVVAEALGRSLAPIPFLSTAVLAVELLRCAEGEVPGALLGEIAAGEVVIATCRDSGELTPTSVDAGYLIDGSVPCVLDGAHADLVLVAVPAAAGPVICLVDTAQAGLSARALPTLDGTRAIADIRFERVAAIPLSFPDSGDRAYSRAWRRGILALAAEQLGGAARCLELAVAYAKERRQFGWPIGSFQAVKHRCADVAVSLEAARAAVLHAAWLADAESESIGLVGEAAAVFCAELFELAAQTLIQVLGGIGFTWEHDAHLYLKRAHGARYLLSSVDELLDDLADTLELVGDEPALAGASAGGSA